MNKSVKWTLIILVIVIIGAIAGKMIWGKDDSGIKVSTEKASFKTITETVNASGKIYPEVEIKVSSDISGEIVELNVMEGDSVRKGQLLARIYADIYALQRDEASSRVNQSMAGVLNSSAALEALKAAMQQDKTTLDRNKTLFDQKVISKAELEQFETRYLSSKANYEAALQGIKGLQAGVQTAEAGLTQANKNLGRAGIVAPMDGVISLLAVKKGERVVGTAQMTGTEMMRVADMSKLEVRVDVGENDIIKINIGDSADVEVDAYNNRKFKGVVTQIASSTTRSGSAAVSTTTDVTNYEVHIRLDPASYSDLIDPSKVKKFPFRPGMNASADIKTKRHDNVLAVPINAVAAREKGSDKSIDDKKKENIKNSSKTEGEEETTVAIDSDELEEVVFIVDKEGKVKKTAVKTSIQDINYIEITSGLKEGDEVVIAPYNAISKTLKDGTKVKVTAKDKLYEK